MFKKYFKKYFKRTTIADLDANLMRVNEELPRLRKRLDEHENRLHLSESLMKLVSDKFRCPVCGRDMTLAYKPTVPNWLGHDPQCYTATCPNDNYRVTDGTLRGVVKQLEKVKVELTPTTE